MPLTPYHLGPASVFGLLLNRYINLTTFVIASVVLDIEPFVVLLFNLDSNLHGISHSFLGGGIIAVILSLLIINSADKLKALTNFLRIKQNFSKLSVWVASFFGIYLHILFDAPLYKDIKPFYPLEINPFYGILSSDIIYGICTALILIGVLIYMFILFSKHLRFSMK